MQSNTTVSHEVYLMTIYNGQLHVSACTGHLQVVLGELKIKLLWRHTPTIALFFCVSVFVLCWFY